MDEQAIEALLKRVQPAAPPAALRARVLRARPARLWPWAAAAAILVAATIPISSLTDRLIRRASTTIATPFEAAAVDDLAAWLGDTEEARAFAIAEIGRLRAASRQERFQ